MRMSTSVVIAAPVEKVFQQWTDLERCHEWIAPVIERRKLTDGPVRVGTRFRATDQWPGRKVEFEMEITEYEENARFGARWYKPMPAVWSSQLTSNGAGTTLEFEIHVKPPLLIRFFNPFLKRWVGRETQAFMASLKERVEQAHLTAA